MTPKIKIIGLEKCGPCIRAAMLAHKHLQPDQYEIIKYDKNMSELQTIMTNSNQRFVPIIIHGETIIPAGQVHDFIRNFNEEKKKE
jgi:glutaredoxin